MISMNFLKFAFFFVLVLVLQQSILAQDWVSYQSQQQVNDLVDTGTELLMATDAGLVVVNKANLTKTFFNKGNTNLKSNHIQTITEGLNSSVWIGTYDVRVAVFDGTDFLEVFVPQGKANNQYTLLYDLKVAPNGDLWLGTSDGVLRRQGTIWTQYDEVEIGATFFKAWDLAINNAGDVFIGSQNVHKFANGTWSNITDTAQISSYDDADLFFSSTGDLYVTGDLDRIGRYDGTQWELFDDFSSQINGANVLKLTEDVNGDMYFNTQFDGIFKLSNTEWLPYSDAQTQAGGDNTTYFYIDQNGDRWLNNGIDLSASKNGNIQSTMISQYPIEHNRTQNVHKGDNGKMYFVKSRDSNFPVVDANGNWTTLQVPMNTGSEFYQDILVLSDTDIWLSSNIGLHHYDGSQWTYNGSFGSFSFARDAQGKIYMRATTKIYIMENGVITEYNTMNSPLSTTLITGFGVDADDNLWIASEYENAIQKVSTTGVWTTYSQADYPALSGPRGDIHFDSNGHLWVRTSGPGAAGAATFDGTTFTNPFTGNFGMMASSEVLSIENDATGKLYFAHRYGVTTLLNGVWGDLLIEDVPNNNGGSHNSNIEFDDAGTLWWGNTALGVFSYTPQTATSVSNNQEISFDFSCYPNPASSYTIVEVVLEKEANVQVVIYNNLGQRLSSINLGQYPSGNFQQTLALEHLPKGFYTIQLQVNNQSISKKIIVQ